MSDDGLALPARIIGWPKSVSIEARDKLKEFGQGASMTSIPDPMDRETWRIFVAEVNAALLISDHYFGVASRLGITSNAKIIAGVRVFDAIPDRLALDANGRVYVDIHGGGLTYLEGEGCRRGGIHEADRLGVRVISIDYRVPPDHPYPAALDDCCAVYRALLEVYTPGQIIVGGISGGGNLAAAMVLRSRDEGLPVPAALVLLTPEVDLTESGDSFEVLAGLDPVVTSKLARLIEAYAHGQDLGHPYLSPLFGDFSLGFPPTFLQSGTRDMFLSNTVRMHRALRKHGVPAELHIWEAMPHGGFRGAPEDEEVSTELRRFVHSNWEAEPRK